MPLSTASRISNAGTIAPSKRHYLRTHWLTVLSLALPALRVIRVFAALRVLRAARVVRSVGLIRILTSVNRGLASLRATASLPPFSVRQFPRWYFEPDLLR